MNVNGKIFILVLDREKTKNLIDECKTYLTVFSDEEYPEIPNALFIKKNNKKHLIVHML